MFGRHTWTQKDVDNAEIRKLNSKEPITMRGFYSICASIGLLLLFTGKKKIEINKEKPHLANYMRERFLQRQKTVEKIKKKKHKLYSDGFLKGPSKKLKGIPKSKILKMLRKGK